MKPHHATLEVWHSDTRFPGANLRKEYSDLTEQDRQHQRRQEQNKIGSSGGGRNMCTTAGLQKHTRLWKTRTKHWHLTTLAAARIASTRRRSSAPRRRRCATETATERRQSHVQARHRTWKR